MNIFNSGFWTFKRPFHFESSSTLDEVVHSLAALEELGDFFSSSHHEDGCTFHYQILRRNRNKRASVTAHGKGQIQKSPTGGVIIEGTAQVEPWSLYGFTGYFIFIALMLGAVGFGPYVPLLFLGSGAIMLISSYHDRNRVINNISQAVNISDQFRPAKDKHASSSEEMKDTHLSVDEVSRPGSLWNNAVSKYEDIAKERYP